MPPTCIALAGHEALWDYMPHGPFVSAGPITAGREREAAEDPRFFVLRDRVTGCGGIASYLRIAPEAVDRGRPYLHRAEMQKGLAATEAMWLMMDWALRRLPPRMEATREPAPRRSGWFSYEGVPQPSGGEGPQP